LPSEHRRDCLNPSENNAKHACHQPAEVLIHRQRTRAKVISRESRSAKTQILIISEVFLS
jgi:hypothetical protein